MKPILSSKVLNYETFVNEKVSKKDLSRAVTTLATVTGILGQFGYDKEWLKDQFLTLFRAKYEEEVSKYSLDSKQISKLDDMVIKPLENGGLEKGLEYIIKQVKKEGISEQYINEALNEIEEAIDWKAIGKKVLKGGKLAWEKAVLPGLKILFNFLAKLLVNITYALVSSFKDEQLTPPNITLFDTKKGKEFLEIKPIDA